MNGATRCGGPRPTSGPRRQLAIDWKSDEAFPLPIPPDEPERLADLHSYDVLDSPPDSELDQITLLASQICGTPIALISLIDSDRQWFKSKVGLTLSESGLLEGTPEQTGSFPIVVKATDSVACSGIGAAYSMTTRSSFTHIPWVLKTKSHFAGVTPIRTTIPILIKTT